LTADDAGPPRDARATPRPVRVGISACLLGREVRWDGGHKRDRLITDTLGRLFDWVPVCPEVEMGLGVPRPILRLEGDPAEPRLVFVENRRDITRAMRAWARARLDALAGEDLCGYILKNDSPSCGMERVRVHRPQGGPPLAGGTGLFARALAGRFPNLPLEEEGRLQDRRLREAFIERVFAYHRRRDVLAAGTGGTRPEAAGAGRP
jgi:uncharacterized protein YbbK (DUF523 family)